jgi:hypothetical protein
MAPVETRIAPNKIIDLFNIDRFSLSQMRGSHEFIARPAQRKAQPSQAGADSCYCFLKREASSNPLFRPHPFS